MSEEIDWKPIPLYSRPMDSNLIGKCTAELPKVKVAEETFDILTRRAKEASMTLTEYLRWNAMIVAHGFDEVQRMQAERLRVVAGMGEEKGKVK